MFWKALHGLRRLSNRNGTREEVPDMLQWRQLKNKKVSPKNADERLIENNLKRLNLSRASVFIRNENKDEHQTCLHVTHIEGNT